MSKKPPTVFEAVEGRRSKVEAIEGRSSKDRCSAAPSNFEPFDMQRLHISPNASSPLRLPSTLRATVWLSLKVKCDSPSFVKKAERVDGPVGGADIELAERAPETRGGR